MKNITLLKLNSRWEHFPHSSDVGIRGLGPTIEAAFEQAALAMVAVITDPDSIVCKTSFNINIRSPNREILFLDWLNEIIFLIATQDVIFGQFKISIVGNHLSGTAAGEKLSQGKHAPAVEIKGATMTELEVYKENSGLWKAQCVLDV